MKWLAICCVVSLLAMGCGTVNPAVYGKTMYKQSFEDIEPDTVTEAGVVAKGQATKYTLEIKAPAGVKLDDITGMQYEWNDEEAKIGINKSGTTDTTGQVEVIKAVTEAITAVANNGMGLAAPIVGQSIAGRQANQAAQIQNQAAFRAQLIEALKELGVQPKPAENPIADVAP